MEEKSERDLSCPLGKEGCPLIEEVIRLRKLVEELSMLVQRDPLTGLYNFRYMLEAISREMERSRRTRMPTSLIMIDLDHFKRVNDYFGHQVGNCALKWCARIWRGEIRATDILCRYGGEEFGVVLPSTGLPHAVRIAERLRRKLEENPVEVDSVRVNLTASFGVGEFQATEKITVEEFIDRTDKFLLEAKKGGRNRVCYEPERSLQVPGELTPQERITFFATRWPNESAKRVG